MNLLCFIVNHLLLGIYGIEARQFSKALKEADAVQQRKLLELLQKNKDTIYGKEHGFSEITSLLMFREQVPLTTYEDYLPYIDRIGSGEAAVLTGAPVKLFEITSGSASASKLIPYTDRLKAEFQAGIKPWIWDLYSRYPKIMTGKSYWSITPVMGQNRKTKAGIPIGFDEDGQYFGAVSRHLMDLIFVSPKGVKQEQDMDAFYFKTALELLKTKELTLVSVWNPTFLLILTDYMKTHVERLLSALPTGRAGKIRDALIRGDYALIWPDLTVISCWCDGVSAGYRKQLLDRFPHAVIQPKGLLATEGFMTFPWGEGDGGVLSIRSHFFEFRNARTGEFFTYKSLVPGELYEIILTTGGGLYRYCIGDTVEVTGFFSGSGRSEGGKSKPVVPLLRFAGRMGNVSDLFGEKLNELFLRKIFSEIAGEYDLDKRFYLVAPSGDHYVLYLEFLKGSADCKEGATELVNQLENRLEQLLCGNFHYEYCRRLGQLKPVLVRHIFGNPRQDYLEFCAKKGQRIGDIKNTVFSADQSFGALFEMEEKH